MKGTIGPKRRILVVDDDPDVRELLRRHLQNAGYGVLTAEDAVTAGHAVVQHVPDLIIADYKMPYMNGRDFISALRADPAIPDIPVVFMTASENTAELAGKTFGFPLLAKPLTVDVVLHVVGSQLRRAAP